MITWQASHHIWALIIIVPLIVLAAYYAYTRARAAHALSLLPGLLRNFSPTTNILKSILYISVLLGILSALLHPSWGTQEETIEQEGRDVYVALDISRSMCTQDVSPDRLTCAKYAIIKLVEALETDRVALILFAQQARIHCPLTSDISLFRAFVQQIDCTMTSAAPTRLAAPIELVIDRCQRDKKMASRVLILVTDGEDFGGEIVTIKERARSCGLTIVLIGVGTTTGGPIPIFDDRATRIGYLKDNSQQVVISQLNRPIIESLARATNGVACMMTSSVIDTQNLINRINQVEKERQGSTHTATSIDRSYLCAAFAALCLLIEWIL